jgi:predicted permease
VAGKTILLEGRPYTVVGVLAPGFRGLSGRAEFWLPASMSGDNALTVRFSHNWFAIGRRKPGVSVREAVAATAVAGAEVDRAHPDNYYRTSWGAHARPLSEVRAEPAARKAGWVFLAAVAFVLLVACANIINLLLTRNTYRRREMAIRQAVGAGYGRLMRQLLVETGVIAAAGGLLGVLLAAVGVRLLASLDPSGENPLFERLPGLTVSALSSIGIDTRVLLFSLAAAMLACLVSGLMPALSALRTHLVEDLKAGAWRRARHIGFGWLAGSRAVVVAEVALAVILATGAGLLIRSFGRLLSIHTGVDADNLLTVSVDTRDLKGKRAEAFFEQLQARIAAIPGVVSVAAQASYPLSGCCSITPIWFPDRPGVSAEAPLIGAYVVSRDYFRTARIPLLRGRLFSAADHETSPKVAVISESAARRFWPGENAIGKRLKTGDVLGEGGEVIGVVGDVRNRRPDEPEPPSIYAVSAQHPGRLGVLFARTEREPTALAAAVRGVVRELDRNLVIRDIKTMRERISDASSKARFGAGLLALFAAIAVALAAVGVYGVMSCSVAQSTREMGIRLALGAGPASLAGLVVRRGAALVCAGLAIGIPAALALSRLLESLLYEVKPADPAAYAATAGVLALVALPACWMPARRAARIDATVALRSD